METGTQLLTIVGLLTSLVIIVSRGWGIVWPAKYREVWLRIADEKQWIHRAMAVFLLVLAGLILLSLAIQLRLLETVLAILFAIFTVVGILMLRFPDSYAKLATGMLKKIPDLGIRISCAAAVLFGIWMIWLVLHMKHMGGG